MKQSKYRVVGQATREQVYKVIDGEREYQRKWEDPELTDSNGKHSLTEFLVYIRDYTEEALHYASRNGDPDVRTFTKHSLRKIAALAVAALEQNGCIARESVSPGSGELPNTMWESEDPLNVSAFNQDDGEDDE